jgi:hypothetical protein
MTRLERCELLKSKGYTYDIKTGKVFGVYGKELINKTTQGYTYIRGGNYFKGGLIGHHYAWFMTYGNVEFNELDHINRIKDDNRISNLRICNKIIQNQNRSFKGYSLDKTLKTNKWIVSIGFNNKQIRVGSFDNEEDAKQSYLNAKQQYHQH